MALWDKLKGELVDVIDWLDDSGDTMVWRFPRYQNEIKYGAKLTVRESQAAVFVSEGRIADVFGPGLYSLNTRNLPVLTTLQKWYHGFESPFKAEVYFLSTRNFTDIKWGTKKPITLRDPEFGPVRLRSFGTYVVRVADPKAFITEIAGTEGHFTVEEITGQLTSMVITRFADLLAESKIPVLDLAANYNELSAWVTTKLAPEFSAYGLDLTKLLIENIALPKAVEEALDKRTSMGIVGDLDAYTKFQAANALEKAAENPSGDASAGVGMGMGFAMANQMTRTMADQGAQAIQPSAAPASSCAAVPPPLPAQEAITYYLGIGGEQKGPFSRKIIDEMIRDKTLTKETLIWRKGMDGWEKAADVQELRLLLGDGPPPLP
ncbi:SPFH domain-containing protein [Desulfoluna spongiiphila]|uniref:Membrane protease subunit, stomatin/prohibitin family, contains C-terminal Zn-ribbon domain n=1 Tax=Desulfoluna spongiiphila TaxID=419481 RepID=A0A1G5HG79_9BACT|nr:SPFH domain-containing protein [Desulfoluna spongiiphila]SCY62786.1 Membrane protease subunit, stomatin/prohibitin family, contains C-terminal Zn-ribbon domain [Desulfoluna spongiiphila]